MKPKLHKTKNDLPASTRGEMIELLNQSLADALALSLAAKQAHWNVKGPHFLSLHELFDKVAGELDEFADLMAERAVALGGVALGTLQVITERTRLPAYPLDLPGAEQHVAALSSGLALIGAALRAAIDTAAKAGDAVTADVFTEVSRGADKLLWLLEAHLQ